MQILIVSLIFPVLGYSQSENIIFDVNLLNLDDSYTKNQVVTIWGEPDIYHQHESEFGLDERYYYGDNCFKFNKGIMNYFYINDKRFSIFNTHIPGGIKVGDPISVFNQLSFGKLHFKGTAGEFYFQIGEADDVIRVRADDQNIITKLIFTVSI